MDREPGERLEEYLDKKIFAGISGETIVPEEENVKGFRVFMDRYKAGLDVEKCAIRVMNWQEE